MAMMAITTFFALSEELSAIHSNVPIESAAGDESNGSDLIMKQVMCVGQLGGKRREGERGEVSVVV